MPYKSVSLFNGRWVVTQQGWTYFDAYLEWVLCPVYTTWLHIFIDFYLIKMQRSSIIYNVVNFLQNSYNRHTIARPSGRAMACLLWVWYPTYGAICNIVLHRTVLYRTWLYQQNQNTLNTFTTKPISIYKYKERVLYARVVDTDYIPAPLSWEYYISRR